MRIIVNFYKGPALIGRWFDAPAVPRVGDEYVCATRLYVVKRVTWRRAGGSSVASPEADIEANLLVEPIEETS